MSIIYLSGKKNLVLAQGMFMYRGLNRKETPKAISLLKALRKLPGGKNVSEIRLYQPAGKSTGQSLVGIRKAGIGLKLFLQLLSHKLLLSTCWLDSY